MKKILLSSAALAALASAVTLTACNLFSPLDSPSGDEQNLAKARACFDTGDFECAAKYYAKLSGTSSADIATSEEAYAILDQNGAGMGNFLGAFAKAKGARSLTKLANSMMATGDGATLERRDALFAAYKKIDDMDNPTSETAGMVRFVTSAAPSAQLLGEEATSLDQTKVTPDTIALDPTVCEGGDENTCAVTPPTECNKPTGSTMVGGSTAYDLDDMTTLEGVDRDLRLFKATLDQINAGLKGLGVGGSFSSVDSFSAAFEAIGFANDGPCFRQKMLSQGIGSEEGGDDK